MSHADTIKSIPATFEIISSTSSVEIAAFKLKGQPLYGIQFHPEVTHTVQGKDLLRNFVVHICNCLHRIGQPDQFVETTVEALQKKLGKR